MDQKKQTEEETAGWLVIRLRSGEGIVLGNNEAEIRVASRNHDRPIDVKLAIKAVKSLLIRRVK